METVCMAFVFIIGIMQGRSLDDHIILLDYLYRYDKRQYRIAQTDPT